MIISHKHKFIFVKTHKTATQTFLKFIKPHLGPDDVMAGDPEERKPTGEIVNENTQINIEKTFDTGMCAKDYQDTYGNHIPWFMIKNVVGDDIWNEYTKFTIERDPWDRLLSLFYFTNSNLCAINMCISPDASEQALLKIKETHSGETDDSLRAEKIQNDFDQFLDFYSKNPAITQYPEQLREYFEDWMLSQLESPVLPLTELDSYGESPSQVIKEQQNIKNTCDKFGLNKFKQMINAPVAWIDPNSTHDQGENEFVTFPYIPDTNAKFMKYYWKNMKHVQGQARFLNYGNYFDGEKVQVDHVVDFKNIGDNLGRMFRDSGIDINCDKNLFNQSTQNAHYRKNIKNKKDTMWWYAGPRGEWVRKVVKRRFFNDNMNEKQINFHKILTHK